MEIPSPDAVVKELRIKVGDKVSKGSPILVLEGSAKAQLLRNLEAPRRRRQPWRGRGYRVRRAGARGGARRLLGGVPRGGPRHEDGAGRALSDARWGMPERRLHPVEGAPAHRGDHGRGARARLARHLVRRAEGGSRQAARVQGQGGRQADRRPRRHGQDAQGDRAAGRRHVPRRNHLEVETKEGKKTVRFGSAIIAAGSQAAKLPFLPEDPRIVDSTGALELRRCRKDADHRRRHHRPRDGHGVLHARRAARRRRDDGRPHARRRPRPRRGVAEVQRAALRQGHAEDENHQGGGDGEGAEQLRRRRAKTYDMVLVSVGRVPNGKKRLLRTRPQ